MPTSPLRLLLIDDNTEFTKTVEIYAAMQGWEIEIGGEALQWQPSGSAPNVVFLDFGLGRGSPAALNAWADKLREQGLLTRTWLLSGSSGEDRQTFVQTRGLRGYLRKPIDLSQIPNLAKQPEVGADSSVRELEKPSFALDALAKKLEPAIDIIDLASLEVVWHNHDDTKQLTGHDRKLLRLLDEELWSQGKGGKPPQRLDWDADKQAFRYTRLYPVKDSDYYWLTRDWRDGEKIHDADLFDLDELPDFKKRLHAAALYLAKRHGITRLRVYKIAELPGVESGSPSPLVMPLFERGGGFKSDAEHWLRTGFLLDDNPETKKASNPRYVCNPERVSDAVEHEGCNNIKFGDAETRAQFPVRSSNGRVRALLAFDRRRDHLDTLDSEDKELAEVALRIAGVFDGPLSSEEVDAMQGLMQDLGARLLGWLKEDETERKRKWHVRISEVLQDYLIEQPKARDAEPFEAVSRICKQLQKDWGEPEIAGRVWGVPVDESSASTDQPPAPLTGWYLALAQGDGQWLPLAGEGAIYRRCKELGSPLPMVPPHKRAFPGGVWQAQVIHDFGAWLAQSNKSREGELPESYRFLTGCVNDIGSWLAVPMPLEGAQRALMVVHSPYRFHFTKLRSQLLEDAARRLLPPVAAALQQSKVRGAFTAAVMHEVKTDAAAALLHCEALEDHWHAHPELYDAETAQCLGMVRHYLEGLSELGRDFLDVLRPDGGANTRFQEDSDYELAQRQQVTAGPWLDNLLRAWRWLYDDRQVTVDDSIGDGPLLLKAPMMLRRVARVLLQNAFRHGEGDITLRLALTDEGRYLQLSITNPAHADVAAGIDAVGVGLTAQIGPAPQARARVGLVNAIRLAKAVQGRLEMGHEALGGKSKDDLVHVQAELYWPVEHPQPQVKVTP